MNPLSMNWIPQETTTAGPHGSSDEKKISLTLKPISFRAAKFSCANASPRGLSGEVLSSNGSNCACRDSSLRLSSRTEIGVWNARNLRDVSASSAALAYIVDFIAASPAPRGDQALLMPSIASSFEVNCVIPTNNRWDGFSNYFLLRGSEFPNSNAAEQLEITNSENTPPKIFTHFKTIGNELTLLAKRVSTSEELITFISKFVATTKTSEIRSCVQTYRKHSPPRPAVDVSVNESISPNSSPGPSGVESIISFCLKGISEAGQSVPNAISRRVWKVNVSQSDGQSLVDGQVSASHDQSTAADCQSSAADCQFLSMEYESYVNSQPSPMDCQPLVMDCNPPGRSQLSDSDWQSSTKRWESSAMNWQSSTDARQLPSANSPSTAPRRSSPGRHAMSRVLLTFLLLTALNFRATSAKIRSRDDSDPVSNIRHVLPELELGNNSVTDVRFNEGSTAFLPCRFPTFPRHHENRVSWIRRWDWHILTAGVFTYTNDDRFVVLHKDGTNDWTLQIKFLQTQDNGTYECQVHTGSGFMSQFVNLFVITPRAAILEPREFTIETGQDFSLTCVIQQSLEPPVYVMWLHGGVPVNYAPDRPRLNVDLIVKGSTSRSILSVKNAKYSDSGNYTCTAPNAVNAWVLVYVTQGDTVAAVQRRQPNASRTVTPEMDGAPALPSITNAAVPLINIFVIPFVSILSRCSSMLLEADFNARTKSLQLPPARATSMSHLPNEKDSFFNSGILKRKCADQFQSHERLKFGTEPSFGLNSRCEERRSRHDHPKFLATGRSIALCEIDFIFSACIYFIALQLITSFLLELRSVVQFKLIGPNSSVFYPSMTSNQCLANTNRTMKIKISISDDRSSVSCFILNGSVWTSR